MADSGFARGPSLWTSKTREAMPEPTPLAAAIQNYSRLVRLPATHGVDPLHEMARAALLARHGVVRISSIATADATLPHGGMSPHPCRRKWRFRALDLGGRLLFERIVQSESPEGAKHEGEKLYRSLARKLGDGNLPEGLIGTVMAV